MLYYKEYKKHVPEILGKKKKFDNTIYTFDIETTSYYTLNGENYSTKEYLKLNKKTREACVFKSTMYIWMFSINDQVYYGRTWLEFQEFLWILNEDVPDLKTVYIHNLSFEFQFLKSKFHFSEVSARKARKVMSATMRDYNIILKCSLMLSNCKLEKLPKLYGLNVEKKVGDLDYSKIRHSKTPLNEKELGYCEYDCLVLYEYIKKERETYGDIKHIPLTSTGKVRRELQERIRTDYKYKRLVKKATNTNPIIFNRLQDAFCGGYTHASYAFANEVIEHVDSYDETSAYPYVLVSYKYPMSEFRPCIIEDASELSQRFAYILVVKFKNVSCKYNNTFISASKCRDIRGAKYDNGRIIDAIEFETTITDVDFKFFLKTYNCEYEIIESYYAMKNYLPKPFIEFILEKYVNKTEFKGVPEKELEYQKEKNKFNSLYGMTVTNDIRSEVIYKDEVEEWFEEELTNDDIVEKLQDKKNKAFLEFSWGVFVTAYARINLLERVIELDDHVVYCDTDSCKVVEGYDKNVFLKYNESVKKRIEFVSRTLGIDISKFAPKDIHGISHMLGIFESETEGDNLFTYDKFITQGAKKYATESNGEIHITVAGVPKGGEKELKTLDDFRDDLVFHFENTNKNVIAYVDYMEHNILTDYLGYTYEVSDKSGCCLVPTTYVLGKSEEYTNLISDASSARARFKE